MPPVKEFLSIPVSTRKGILPVSRTTTWRPYAALFIGLLAVASASILIRLSQQEGASSLVIAGWRVTLATLILTPLIFLRYRDELRRITPGQLGLAVLSGLFLALHFAAWITSLEYTSVLISVTLVTTNPLMVALATPFLLREKISRGTLGAILLAVVGGAIISAAGGVGTAPRQDAPLLGIGLSLLGAVAVAAYYIIGRRLRATISVIPYIWITYGAAAVTLLVVIGLNQMPVGGLSPNAYLWMTLMAIFPQLIGHSSFNYALGYLSAAFVSLTVIVEPILSSIMAFFLLQEQPKALQVAGSALILIALVLASREEVRAEGQKRAAQAVPIVD